MIFMNSFLRYPLILLMLIVTLSCSKTESFFYEIIEPEIVTGLVVHSSYLRNQEITFEVFDEDGNNITMDSSFIVDGVSIVGNQVSYPEIGTHQVYAEYSIESTLYNSDTKIFNIVIPKTRVVLEDYTGTWCGYCPNVTHAIDEIRMITDDISVVAIHYGDEMTISSGLDLINEFNPSANNWCDTLLLQYENDCPNRVDFNNDGKKTSDGSYENGEVEKDTTFIIDWNNMDIDNQIIEDYLNYGVVLIKGAINPFWLNKLAVGIDKNFNNPSKFVSKENSRGLR